ncbi:MAG: GGDEF domain-containing protein [Myxococcaceae bacterium]
MTPSARISVVIRYVSWVGIVAHAGFIPLFAWLEHPRLAAFNVASVAIWVTATLANRFGRATLAMWLIFGEVTVHALLATTAFGWESGFQYYLIPLIPFVMFNDRLKTLPVWLASGAVFGAFLYLRWASPPLAIDPRIAKELQLCNVAIPFLALALVSYYFRLASITAEQQMEKAAVTDPLTGLYNRRHMSVLLAEAEARFKNEQRPFSVIVADVDHFKRINDTHGHATGDQVLCEVAKTLREQLRDADAVARWGGEEFLVLLRDVPPERALEVARRIHKGLEKRFQTDGNPAKGLTVTLGLASVKQGVGVEAVIASADRALYQGKEAGRNRVVAA